VVNGFFQAVHCAKVTIPRQGKSIGKNIRFNAGPHHL
jgi:hypothetical protein